MDSDDVFVDQLQFSLTDFSLTCIFSKCICSFDQNQIRNLLWPLFTKTNKLCLIYRPTSLNLIPSLNFLGFSEGNLQVVLFKPQHIQNRQRWLLFFCFTPKIGYSKRCQSKLYLLIKYIFTHYIVFKYLGFSLLLYIIFGSRYFS